MKDSCVHNLFCILWHNFGASPVDSLFVNKTLVARLQEQYHISVYREGSEKDQDVKEILEHCLVIMFIYKWKSVGLDMPVFAFCLDDMHWWASIFGIFVS